MKQGSLELLLMKMNEQSALHVAHRAARPHVDRRVSVQIMSGLLDNQGVEARDNQLTGHRTS